MVLASASGYLSSESLSRRLLRFCRHRLFSPEVSIFMVVLKIHFLGIFSQMCKTSHLLMGPSTKRWQKGCSLWLLLLSVYLGHALKIWIHELLSHQNNLLTFSLIQESLGVASKLNSIVFPSSLKISYFWCNLKTPHN